MGNVGNSNACWLNPTSLLVYLTGGGPRGDGSTEDALVSGQIDLDGGVTARVVDLSGENLLDRHFEAGCAVRTGDNWQACGSGAD